MESKIEEFNLIQLWKNAAKVSSGERDVRGYEEACAQIFAKLDGESMQDLNYLDEISESLKTLKAKANIY